MIGRISSLNSDVTQHLIRKGETLRAIGDVGDLISGHNDGA